MDVVGWFDAHAAPLVRVLQAAIAGIFVFGVVTGNPSVVVNAAASLGVTLLPGILERDYSISLGPGITLWLTVAVLLHAVGFLGPYDTVSWWDSVTHTLSASIVAAAGYAAALSVARASPDLELPPAFMFVYVLLFTLAVGVLWEVLEFSTRFLARALGMGPFLVQYGVEDTLTDLLFDAVGALLVATFGTDALSAFVDQLLD